MPTRWFLSMPLRQRGRLFAILGCSLATAALRGLSLVALYPLLKVLLADDWKVALGARVEELPAAVGRTLRPPLEWLSRGSALEALGWILAGVVLLTLLRAGFRIGQEILTSRLVHRAVRTVHADLHAVILRGAGSGRPDGELLSLFQADADALRVAWRRLAGKVIREPLHVIGSLVVLLWIDARLALVSGLAFPLVVGPLLFLSRKLRHRSRRGLDRTGELSSSVEETLRGRRTIQAFGLQDRETRRFDESQRRLTEALLSVDRREALASPILEVLGAVAAGLLVLLGFSHVTSARLDAEAFLLFYVTLLSFLDPLRKLADTQVRMQRGIAAASRVRHLVDSLPARPVLRGTTPFPASLTLEVDAIGVREEQEEQQAKVILDGIRFDAGPGLVLLAGPSGAGKSTLLDVIAGLREPSAGAVRFGGVPLAALAPDSFRSRVCLVAQESFFFRGSIEENITLGATPRGFDLAAVLAMAHLGERLAELGAGLTTPLESIPFSAGERQRLALARALYRDPAVLLLDEATSALDRPTEARIVERLHELASERIVLLITHRVSADFPADRVLVLENGRLRDHGKLADVMAGSALFQQLVEGHAP